MRFVYIIYSKKSDKYYIGETYEIEQRLMFHNSTDDNTNSTKSGIPWVLFLALQVENRIIARRIETHIKRMKSKIYIQNLKQYPEMQLKLINKHS